MIYAGEFAFHNASAHIGTMKLDALLNKIQEQEGWNQTELGKKVGVTQPTISRWKSGEDAPIGPNEKKLLQLARQLRVINHVPKTDGLAVPVVGYVGAGGQVAYAEGQGPFGEAPMPPGATPGIVAVTVRGDSLGVLGNDATIYYDNRQDPPTDALLGRLCVIGLPDGRILVKTLLKGSKPGLFHLIAVAGPNLMDHAVDWAARVSFIGYT